VCHNCATEDHRIFCGLPIHSAIPRVRSRRGGGPDASLSQTVGLAPASSTDLEATDDEPYVRGALGRSPTFQRIGDKRAADCVSVDAPRQVFSFEGFLNRPGSISCPLVQRV